MWQSSLSAIRYYGPPESMRVALIRDDLPGDSCSRVTNQLRASVIWLLAAQDDDGAWREYECSVGQSTSWTTALTLMCLSFVKGDDLEQLTASVKHRACGFLRRAMRPTGGWGYNEDVAEDCDAIAHAVLALRLNGFDVPQRSLSRLLDYEVAPGAFRTFADRGSRHSWGTVHPEVGAVAAIALSDEGRMARVWASLESEIEQFGVWTSFWWNHPVYPTFTALWLRSEMTEPSPLSAKVRSVIENSVGFDEVAHAALSGLIAVKVGSVELATKALDVLAARQLEHGGWPGSAFVRLPEPNCTSEWRDRKPLPGLCVVDKKGILTTALAVRFLAELVADSEDDSWPKSHR